MCCDTGKFEWGGEGQACVSARLPPRRRQCAWTAATMLACETHSSFFIERRATGRPSAAGVRKRCELPVRQGMGAR